ncbi:zinc finger protein 62 homolog [Mizuhopecten yessoensis]|uniref:Zinc finger protein 37-like n=1 Tax=Mizuhopecten yessoensis TaxID=6573 RepID=A0A210PSD3_MIZYE|nr:zinc finger protein 62 homolog [Mizuhopecten yessoensis]XP_021376315.1 zinc finger protein 62 homolog [Mizuhopecten yessoensis]XP_021376317.1 zinc finger protein 62 homolog [Mizuhopecten yessoensis]OWF39417.1 Zinc finger protein 37-like [Mizuhopecten yessoensis]
MATDPPDILEQALAEVGPYIGLDTGSEVNQYSSAETGSEVNPYISSQTDKLVQDIQALCTRLAEEGEETLFISVNVSGNQCAYLGSTFGKDYIEKNGLVQGFFSYCNERYESRVAQSSSPVKSPQKVISQESGHTANIVSQLPVQNISQTSKQPPNNVISPPQTIYQTPVSVPTSSTAYRSLLTKEGIQELAKRSLSELDDTEQTSKIDTGPSVSTSTGTTGSTGSMTTGTVRPSVSTTTGTTGSSVSMVTSTAGHSVSLATKSAESSTTTGSRTETSLDKSIGTDFPDDEESRVPISKSLARNNQKEGTGEKYVVYIQKSPDSNSNKSVLVYKRPEDLQKNTLQKLGLVKSDGLKNTEKKQTEIIKSATITKDPDELSKSQEVAGTGRRRGRPPKTRTAAQTGTSEVGKVTNPQTPANKTSSNTQTTDRTASRRTSGHTTRLQATGESSSKQSPLRSRGSQAVDTLQRTPEGDTKGPFLMRTRSGGKAKHMPWLNKWKDNDDKSQSEEKKPKERKAVVSPEQQTRSGKRRKELAGNDDVRKKIKIEVESDDEDTVETQSIGLVTSAKSLVADRKSEESSHKDMPSIKQMEFEEVMNNDLGTEDVSEKQVNVASNDKPADIGAGGDSMECASPTETDTEGNVDDILTGNTGIGEGEATVEREDARTDDCSEKCEICGDVFGITDALIKHMQDDHDIRSLHEEDEDEGLEGLDKELKGEDLNECELCGKVFRTALRLKLHRKVHDSGQYVCSVCGKIFLHEQNLSRHILQKHTNKRYPCTECQEMFKTIRQRNEHLAIKHSLPAVLRCKHCALTFTDAKSLRTHSKSHVTPCMCEFCGKSFSRRADLVMHRRIHTKEKPIKCLICGRGFARASTLLSHKLTHRTYNAFQCEVCGRTFKTKESMRQHRKVHTKESTVPCDHCTLKFRTFDGMKNHIIQCHEDIKPPKSWNVYTCDKCPKKFGGKQQFIRHMSVHTGVRPYDCNLCGKSYPTQGALNTHRKIHKECMPTRQFHCNVCNLHFGILSKMKRHMETAKHIQYCMSVGVDPMGNLREYEAKISSEGNLRAHPGGVQVPSDGSMPIIIKSEVPELSVYEGDETVECVLIHLPDDEVALQDGAQIVYSINTEDGTIESVLHESAPQEEIATEQPQ